MSNRTRITADNTFSIIPHWVIFSGISSGAIHLYAVLAKYADNTTGDAFPSRARLAEDIGKSRDTVDRHMIELKKIGAVKITKRFSSHDQRQHSNLYTLITANPNAPEIPDSIEAEEGAADLRPGSRTDAAQNYTHVTTSTPPHSVRHHPAGDDQDSSLRSPSPAGRGRTLKDLAKTMATTRTEHDTDAFLAAFETAHGTEPGYRDYGWEERLWDLTREHGLDYGVGKWLSIFTNAALR